MGRPTKEYQAFTSLVDALLRVPKDEIVPEAAYNEESAKNPRKRGRRPAIAACTAGGDSKATDRGSRTRGDESLRSISGDACRRAPQVGRLAGTGTLTFSQPNTSKRLRSSAC